MYLSLGAANDRWNVPPHVILEATEFATLNTIPLDTLENFCVTLG